MTAHGDDAALLLRLRGASRAERDALFDEIYREHEHRILTLCRHLCGNATLAEDALQEAFIDVYRGLPAFRGDARIGTWIYRIAVRTALRVRSRYDRPAEAMPDAPEARTLEPHAALVAREQARRVQAALDALPAEQRVVVALFAVEGLSHAEIGEILGIPEGTVWSRLHKGRKAIAEALR